MQESVNLKNDVIWMKNTIEIESEFKFVGTVHIYTVHIYTISAPVNMFLHVTNISNKYTFQTAA
jgi:hypothetical protein